MHARSRTKPLPHRRAGYSASDLANLCEIVEQEVEAVAVANAVVQPDRYPSQEDELDHELAHMFEHEYVNAFDWARDLDTA